MAGDCQGWRLSGEHETVVTCASCVPSTGDTLPWSSHVGPLLECVPQMVRYSTFERDVRNLDFYVNSPNFKTLASTLNKLKKNTVWATFGGHNVTLR